MNAQVGSLTSGLDIHGQAITATTNITADTANITKSNGNITALSIDSTSELRQHLQAL